MSRFEELQSGKNYLTDKIFGEFIYYSVGAEKPFAGKGVITVI